MNSRDVTDALKKVNSQMKRRVEFLIWRHFFASCWNGFWLIIEECMETWRILWNLLVFEVILVWKPALQWLPIFCFRTFLGFQRTADNSTDYSIICGSKVLRDACRRRMFSHLLVVTVSWFLLFAIFQCNRGSCSWRIYKNGTTTCLH